MKKLILTIAIFAGAISFASAQVLPSFQFGIKGGVNLTGLDNSSSTFNSSNRAGYLAGFWARVGALGFNFQPELYITSKNVDISDNNESIKAKFTSIDVPLLFGGKAGAFGFGFRYYTGPLISFAINKDQSVSRALGDVTSLDYKDQNFAWQFGIGMDVRKISLDLRYEAGITKQTYDDQHTRVSLFNLTLAVPLTKF